MTSRDTTPGPADLPAEDSPELDDRWISLLDTALRAQAPVARRYVQGLRAKKPGASTEELMRALTLRYSVLATGTGAGIGGVAAMPGIGTATALGLTVGEGLVFAEASAFLTLAAADIHDVDMRDAETRRLVLMAVLSGSAAPRSSPRASASRACSGAPCSAAGEWSPASSPGRSRATCAAACSPAPAASGWAGCCPSASAP